MHGSAVRITGTQGRDMVLHGCGAWSAAGWRAHAQGAPDRAGCRSGGGVRAGAVCW